MLSEGKRPPEEFGRPEVIDILIDYYLNGHPRLTNNPKSHPIIPVTPPKPARTILLSAKQ
jgi:hypothetical protein